jgi:hypothetical protein
VPPRGRRRPALAPTGGFLFHRKALGIVTQGRASSGMTYDWKAWDGTPHGYEGLLVDG